MDGRYECSLYGRLVQKEFPEFKDRLVALWNLIDFDWKENLYEHEMVFVPEGYLTMTLMSIRGNPSRSKS
jgi:hypothetical protein